MPIKVYTYDKCDTCRKAMHFLRKKGLEITPIPIRQQPPTVAELKRMLKLYDGNLRKLFNTSGRDYKEQKIGEKLDGMSETEAISLLAGNGNLVKRPFLLADDKGSVGFDEKAWQAVLS